MMEGAERVLAYPMMPPPAVRAARIKEVYSSCGEDYVARLSATRPSAIDGRGEGGEDVICARR